MAISTVGKARSQHALATRYYPDPEHPRRIETKRDMVAASIKAAIEKHLADAPRLTPSQIDELTHLLRRGVR